ncbi:hypothetical protein Syun_003171 [Stephania yunnanensis]|uniref:Uncharacterized protein n=1 Tax=Stephania yunnanensis TaxID=152371 RepID=A0AAP0L4K1_9MAGN
MVLREAFSDGRGPTNLLDDICSSWRPESLENEEGISPSKLFPLRSKTASFPKFPKE